MLKADILVHPGLQWAETTRSLIIFEKATRWNFHFTPSVQTPPKKVLLMYFWEVEPLLMCLDPSDYMANLDIAGYRIYRSNQQKGSLAGGMFSCCDSGCSFDSWSKPKVAFLGHGKATLPQA